MSENTNLVKTWAENIKADAETAVKELTGKDFDYGSRQKVLASVCEIKGACEAIIAAVSNPENRCKRQAVPKSKKTIRAPIANSILRLAGAQLAYPANSVAALLI